MDDSPVPDGGPVRASRHEVVLEFMEDGELHIHIGNGVSFSNPQAWRDIKFTATLPRGRVRIVSRMTHLPFDRIDTMHREPVTEREVRNFVL